jgi:hypothetical protein
LLQQPVTSGGVIVIVTRRWECHVRPYSEQWWCLLCQGD